MVWGVTGRLERNAGISQLHLRGTDYGHMGAALVTSLLSQNAPIHCTSLADETFLLSHRASGFGRVKVSR